MDELLFSRLIENKIEQSEEWSFILSMQPMGGHVWTMKIDLGLFEITKSRMLSPKVGSRTNWVRKFSANISRKSVLARLPVPAQIPPRSLHLISEWLKSPRTKRFENNRVSTAS